MDAWAGPQSLRSSGEGPSCLFQLPGLQASLGVRPRLLALVRTLVLGLEPAQEDQEDLQHALPAATSTEALFPNTLLF